MGPNTALLDTPPFIRIRRKWDILMQTFCVSVYFHVPEARIHALNSSLPDGHARANWVYCATELVSGNETKNTQSGIGSPFISPSPPKLTECHRIFWNGSSSRVLQDDWYGWLQQSVQRTGTGKSDYLTAESQRDPAKWKSCNGTIFYGWRLRKSLSRKS